jgi:oxalate decarboxylase/phosphoglucose isomerase-like protein (cupin superfamily)
MPIRRLVLQPGAVREPHWHTNGNELTYCLRGAAVVTVFANGSRYHRFTLRSGQMCYVPSGALHTIEIIGDAEAEFIATLTHERPEEFGPRPRLRNVLVDSAQRPGVVAAAFGVAAEDLPVLPFTPVDPLIVGRVNAVDPVSR